MTLALLIGAAQATTSTTCWAGVEETVPADGAVVPTDAVFIAILDVSSNCDGSPEVRLLDAGGASVAGVTTVDPGSWIHLVYRFTRTAPLVYGAGYTFRAESPVDSGEAPVDIAVTVGDALPFPAVPPVGTFTVEDHTCGSDRVDLALRIDSELPLSGLLTTRWSVDGDDGRSLVAVDQQTVIEDTTRRPFGFDICTSAALEDLSGREVWTMAEVCAPALECPTYDPPASSAHEVRPLCDRVSPTTELTVHVTLPPADPGAYGILELSAWSAASTGRSTARADGDGRDWSPDLHVNVPGLRPVCFDLSMTDNTGAERWRAEPSCTHELLSCPDERIVDPLVGIGPPVRDPPREAGACARGSGGCASDAQTSVGWLAVGFGVALSARRARRSAKRVRSPRSNGARE